MRILIAALPIALLLCLSASSCKKKKGDNQDLDPNNQSVFDFMSSKEGSTWRYGVKDGVSYTRFARGKDTVKEGLTYRYFERKDDNAGFQPEYFGRNRDSYLTLIDIDNEARNYINFLFWKDGAGAGASWNNTGSVDAPVAGKVALLLETSVVDDKLSMQFSGLSFEGAAHVHSDVKAGPLKTRIGTLDIWFVKGLGVIREEVDLDILGQFKLQHTDSLLEYHLVP